jgi:hypothetical protein
MATKWLLRLIAWVRAIFSLWEAQMLHMRSHCRPVLSDEMAGPAVACLYVPFVTNLQLFKQFENLFQHELCLSLCLGREARRKAEDEADAVAGAAAEALPSGRCRRLVARRGTLVSDGQPWSCSALSATGPPLCAVRAYNQQRRGVSRHRHREPNKGVCVQVGASRTKTLARRLRVVAESACARRRVTTPGQARLRCRSMPNGAKARPLALAMLRSLSHSTAWSTVRRLAYGTDQGRWLAQQVAASGAEGGPKRRARPPQRVYHALDDAPLSDMGGSSISAVRTAGDPAVKAATSENMLIGIVVSVLILLFFVAMLLRFS